MPVDDAIRFEIVVLDNGSADGDWRLLQKGIDQTQVTLRREAINRGFAGGHNIMMQIALDKALDFVWLVNSDAVIEPDCLSRLVAFMNRHADCGATSPVIIALDDPTQCDFCGAGIDWAGLETPRPKSIAAAQAQKAATPNATWVAGTVVLYRVRALAQTGLLDAALFAYYEDTDIGVRLMQRGWTSLVAFDAIAHHLRYLSDVHHRPPYYFYLMTRNSILFWLNHVPAPHRRLLRVRLLDRSLFLANRLILEGELRKADACLLGIADGLLGKGGAPQLARPVPRYMQLLRGCSCYSTHDT